MRQTSSCKPHHTNILFFFFPVTNSTQSTYSRATLPPPAKSAHPRSYHESEGPTLSGGWTAKRDKFVPFFPTQHNLNLLFSVDFSASAGQICPVSGHLEPR